MGKKDIFTSVVRVKGSDKFKVVPVKSSDEVDKGLWIEMSKVVSRLYVSIPLISDKIDIILEFNPKYVSSTITKSIAAPFIFFEVSNTFTISLIIKYPLSLKSSKSAFIVFHLTIFPLQE